MMSKFQYIHSLNWAISNLRLERTRLLRDPELWTGQRQFALQHSVECEAALLGILKMLMSVPW